MSFIFQVPGDLADDLTGVHTLHALPAIQSYETIMTIYIPIVKCIYKLNIYLVKCIESFPDDQSTAMIHLHLYLGNK